MLLLASVNSVNFKTPTKMASNARALILPKTGLLRFSSTFLFILSLPLLKITLSVPTGFRQTGRESDILNSFQLYTNNTNLLSLHNLHTKHSQFYVSI